MEQIDVVVIGAGVAGLACARTLLEAGMAPVVVEARDTIGGRVRTLRRDGACVELGAQVIHPSHDDLLLAELAACGLATTPLGVDAQVFVVMDGKREDAATVAGLRPPPPWVIEQRFAQLSDLDASVAAALEVLPPPSRRGGAAWLEQVLGASPDAVHVGALAASRAGRLMGQESVVVDGFDRLAGALAQGLDVRTNSAVALVRWGGQQGRCALEVTGQGPVQAAMVVVTVPPSAVLAGAVAFTPALPAERLRAARDLASHDAAVVVLEAAQEAQAAAWVLLVDPPGGLWRAEAGSRLVTGHLKGAAAAAGRAADWSSCASSVAGQIDPAMGAAQCVALHDWGRDPWAGGAYSVPVAGAQQAATAWGAPLASAVGSASRPRLFFAGEACAPPGLAGLVQGALHTGRRAAAQILRQVGAR